MKTYDDLKQYVAQSGICGSTPVYVAIRPSAFGDVEWLTLIVEGNGLNAASEDMQGKAQLVIKTVRDLLMAKRKSDEDSGRRHATMYESAFRGDLICPSILRKGTWHTGGFAIKSFHIIDGKFALEAVLLGGRDGE